MSTSCPLFPPCRRGRCFSLLSCLIDVLSDGATLGGWSGSRTYNGFSAGNTGDRKIPLGCSAISQSRQAFGRFIVQVIIWYPSLGVSNNLLLVRPLATALCISYISVVVTSGRYWHLKKEKVWRLQPEKSLPVFGMKV